ncbi:hypothetical protein DRP77_11700 [Candidatus Poribacteria bacterium]|mgnify:FL=1|nr:MAG: hypothetical protein DRP77_11700 [Candidatus Poribacteria bacterium]
MVGEKEKFLKEVSLQGDGIVRSRVSITYPVWKEYGEALNELQGLSPHVSVGIARSPSHPAYHEATDRWGCKWIYPLEALDGQCVGHPIESWADLDKYRPPDPERFTNWEEAKRRVEEAKSKGRVAWGHTEHGFLYLRLTYLRGFENFMMDVAEGRPELDRLIGMIEEFWLEVVRRWIEIGVDAINFGDDLGLQNSLPISPDAWRRYIKPSYKRIFSYCRQNGVHVYLHTDGYIVDIIPDLIECGVSILNPQDLVNGLDNIEKLAKGRVFIDLDIDRQKITVFGTPEEVEEHVLNCIKKLGSPKGGLSLIWGVYPPTPLENIKAAVEAMGKYATYWASKEG